MANIRTLKLNLLADTTDFAAGIKRASGQTNTFAKDIARNAKIAAAAATGFAVAFGVSAVKAAIDDQKAQKQLSIALKNTTGATNKQVAAVEDYITQQGKLLGVTDDELRPALAKLVRVTGDVKKSQDLLSLALDISAGTGKSLESVTSALTRAQQGNLAGLKKLGVPLSDTIIKNKDLGAALKIADDRFKGAAKAAGETMAGKLKIFKTAMDESKESIGKAIIIGLQPMAEKWLPLVTTGVGHFVDGLTGQGDNGGLKGAIKDNQEAVFNLGQDLKGFFKFLGDNKGLLGDIAGLMAAIFIGAKAYGIVSAMTGALRLLAAGFIPVTAAAATAAGAEAAATGGLSLVAALPAIAAIASAFGVLGLLAAWKGSAGVGNKFTKGQVKSAVVTGQNLQKVGVGAGQFGGTQYGTALENSGGNLFGGGGRGKPRSFRQSSNNVTINMNGVIDGESARRSIEKVLQESSNRTGVLNLNGSLL